MNPRLRIVTRARDNVNVAGFTPPIKKVALALTLIKKPEVPGWTRDLRPWLNQFNPASQNLPAIWNTFPQTTGLDSIRTAGVLWALRSIHPHTQQDYHHTLWYNNIDVPSQSRCGRGLAFQAGSTVMAGAVLFHTYGTYLF